MKKRGLKSDKVFVYTFCCEYSNYIFNGEDTPESIRETALVFVSHMEKYDTLCAGLWAKRCNMAKKPFENTVEGYKKGKWE